MNKIKTITIAFNGITRELSAIITKGKKTIAESITIINKREGEFEVKIFDQKRSRQILTAENLKFENINFKLKNVSVSSYLEGEIEIYLNWNTVQLASCVEGYVPGQRTWVNYYEYKKVSVENLSS